jgi:pimeloyl-ACP methyl ester carboxylesterase
VRRGVAIALGACALAASLAPAGTRADLDAAQAEVVVLLHGLGRSPRSMQPLAERLAGSGYAVHNLRYASTELSPAELTAWLERELAGCCAQAPRLHFVTHSLGGVLVRAYLAERQPENLGRVVMLAPPNHGSELVDAFAESTLLRAILGPTAAELGTGAGSLPNRLPPPSFEVGVIAGTRSLSPLGAFVVPGEDDGTVSVASTRLEGMADFVAVDASHTFIMRSPEVGSQVLSFLRAGRFRSAEPQ